MVSFFSTAAKAKKLPIPLWAVGMIGEFADMSWALTNAFVIDPEVFADFRAHTCLSVFKHQFWHSVGSGKSNNKNPLLNKAVEEAKAVDSGLEVEKFLKKWSAYHFAHALWTEVIEHGVWTNAFEYITFVVENQASEISYSHRRVSGLPSKTHYFPYNSSMTQAQNFAYLCCKGNSPYPLLVSLMMQFKLGSKSGMRINSMEEGGETKFMASVNITDPKAIFMMHHVLNAQSLNVVELMGVNSLAEEVSSLGVDQCDELDTVTENVRISMLAMQSRRDNELFPYPEAALRTTNPTVANNSDDEAEDVVSETSDDE